MIDYKLLPRADVLSVTDIAHYHLHRLRTPADGELPLRVVAKLREDLPNFLQYSFYFEKEWLAGRDVYCRANEIDFVIDKVTVKRMRGCTIRWEGDELQGGFCFDNPAWPPASPEATEVQESSEPQVDTATSNSGGMSKTGLGIGGAVGMMLLVGGLRFAVHMAGQAEEQAKANVVRRVHIEKALEEESERLRERMRRGEDIEEALLTVLGMDPEVYKKYQQSIRAKQAAEEQTPP